MKRLLLAVLLAAAGRASAVETAAFLNVGAGARGLALGGAYTALADDSSAIYWNPAGLSALEKREAAASHAELAGEARHDFVAFAQPTSQGTFAGALTYVSYPSLEGRDASGAPTSSFGASDAAAAFAFARKTPLADAGVSVKYLRSHIGSAEAQSFAVDAGLRRALGAWTVGAALRNAGPGMKFGDQRNDLPLRLSLGAAYRLEGGHALSAEAINGPRGAGTDFGFGGEFQAVKNVFLRAGYTTLSAQPGGSGFDAARGLTLGVGWRDERWMLDYAAVPMGELGSTHRFTLGARW